MYYLPVNLFLIVFIATFSYFYYIYVDSYTYFLCNNCVHKECPLNYIQKVCEDAQEYNTKYNEILNEEGIDEYERLRKYSILRGNEMRECIHSARTKCYRFCDECIDKKEENTSYEIRIHAQKKNETNYHLEDCLLERLDFFSIYSECWISIDKEKCIKKYTTETNCL